MCVAPPRAWRNPRPIFAFAHAGAPPPPQRPDRRGGAALMYYTVPATRGKCLSVVVGRHLDGKGMPEPVGPLPPLSSSRCPSCSSCCLLLLPSSCCCCCSRSCGSSCCCTPPPLPPARPLHHSAGGPGDRAPPQRVRHPPAGGGAHAARQLPDGDEGAPTPRAARTHPCPAPHARGCSDGGGPSRHNLFS
jgi:hypothetical protein